MSVVTESRPFAMCNHRGFDYEPLVPAVAEITGGHGMLTTSSVKPLNVAVDEVKYTRETSYIPVSIKSSNMASLSVIDGVLTANEFTIAGDHVFNPAGHMLSTDGAEPLLGDLLTQSYLAMCEGSHSVANAFVKASYLIIRLIGENRAPSLIATEFESVVPFAL